MRFGVGVRSLNLAARSVSGGATLVLMGDLGGVSGVPVGAGEEKRGAGPGVEDFRRALRRSWREVSAEGRVGVEGIVGGKDCGMELCSESRGG